jgi:DNA-binding transcriptional LysR family regulator
MDRLRAMRLFVSVVQARSYTAAARQSGLSRPHVSKQIKELEDSLGTRLLNRTTRQVRPTELGQAYFERCVRILGELDEAEFELGARQGEPRGTLKLLAPKSLAILELVDALREFTRRYPKLEVSVFVLDEQLDVVEHGFDLALRFGEQPDSALVGRRLCFVDFVACASPAYLREHGTPRHPRELAQHECLRHSTLSQDSRWRFDGPDGPIAVQVRGALAANNTVFLRECLLRGSGIALMPSYSVRRDIEAGRLVPILEQYNMVRLPLFAVYPHRGQLASKVRLCIDFLTQWFKAQSTLYRQEPGARRPGARRTRRAAGTRRR